MLRPPRNPGEAEQSTAVAAALAWMGSPPEARRALAEALGSEDPKLRAAALRAYAAGVRGDLEVSRRLIRCSTSENPAERAAATRALI